MVSQSGHSDRGLVLSAIVGGLVGGAWPPGCRGGESCRYVPPV